MMYGLPLITFFVTREVIRQWFSLMTASVNNIFVTSEATRQWVSRVVESLHNQSPYEWQKSLLTVTHALFDFLRAILCPEHPNQLKTITGRSSRRCLQGPSVLI